MSGPFSPSTIMYTRAKNTHIDQATTKALLPSILPWLVLYRRIQVSVLGHSDVLFSSSSSLVSVETIKLCPEGWTVTISPWTKELIMYTWEPISTGISTLPGLKNFPISQTKIDQLYPML